MGYTHYWAQRRSFTIAEWAQVSADIGEILKDAQHNQGIALANEMGDAGTSPVLDDNQIMFNGLGEDSHESFVINRRRGKSWEGAKVGRDFCKTARKPYDLAVVAVLCYLATVTRKDHPETGDPIIGSEIFSVTSDGHGNDWVEGLEEARRALPRVANQLDIPMDIMKADRWCGPWVNDAGGPYSSGRKSQYHLEFCIDGKAYLLRQRDELSVYCWATHREAAEWLTRTREAPGELDIWHPTGSFNPARWQRLANWQTRRYQKLIETHGTTEQQPPAYVRPGQIAQPEERAYYIHELLTETA